MTQSTTKPIDRRVPLTSLNYAAAKRLAGDECTVTEFVNTILSQVLQPVQLSGKTPANDRTP
ncbi:hypothetical protein Lepto7375DRAFT_1094 [Leptolyngbya sp. PCC 7375]|nr:hypothetical protein Lepto7375DRAFT_1094 [Leptolyngbya sp. PCC 7375]